MGLDLSARYSSVELLPRLFRRLPEQFRIEKGKASRSTHWLILQPGKLKKLKS